MIPFHMRHIDHPLYIKAVKVITSAKTKEQYKTALQYAELCSKKYRLETGEHDYGQFMIHISKIKSAYEVDMESNDPIEEIKQRYKDDGYFDSNAKDDIRILLEKINELNPK